MQQLRTFYPQTFIKSSRGNWTTLLSLACALSVVMAATGCATDNDTTPSVDRSDDIASDGGDGLDIQDAGVIEQDATVGGEDSNEDSVSPLDDIEEDIQAPDPFEQPDFSISISSDVLIEHVNRVLGFQFGVPVARHVLASVGACRVICNQEILGATCRPLMMWSDEKASVQWIGVSWSGRIKSSSCTLEVIEEDAATDPAPLISEADGVYTIDTGGQTALLDPTSSDVLLEDIGGISGTAMRLRLVDTDGAVYTGEVTSTNLVVNDTSTSILHLQGDYIRADPPSIFNAFEVRIYANAGAAHLGLEHKLIVTSDAIQTREIASLTVEISGTTPSSNPDTDLLFDAVDHARLTVGASVSEFDHKVGALEVTTDGYTLGLGLRHAHEEYPKRLMSSSVDGGFRLVADLWPIKDGDKALIDTHPKGLKNELKDVDKWFCVGALDFILNVNGISAEPCLDWVTATEAEKLELVAQLEVFPDAPVILSDFVGDISQLDDFVETCGDLCTSRWMIYDSRGDYRRTAQGVAKTHWLAISAVPGAVEPIIGAVDAEPFVRIAPEYIASTEVFGRYFPATEGRFEDIESFIEEAYGALQGDAPPLYGVLRHGVHYNQHAKTVLATAHSADNTPEKYLGFYNQEAHDIVDMLWWRYLRTGSRASYVEAIRSSRYTADVLTVWDYAEPGRVGLQRRHSLYPWSDISPSHTLTGGVMTAHLLSGLDRYRDAVLLGGQAALAHYSEDSGLFSALPVAAFPEVANSGTSLRGHTALWHGAMNAFRLSGDPELLAAIDGFANTLVAVQKSNGLLPSQITLDSGGTLYGKNSQGYGMSISRAVADYLRFFPVSDGMVELLHNAAAHQVTDSASSELFDVQARYFELLGEAYFQDDNDAATLPGSPALLIGREFLERALASGPTSVTTRFLGRGIGFLLAATADWEDSNPSIATDAQERGAAVFSAWQEYFFAQPLDIGGVELRRPPLGNLTAYVAEATDRWSTLEYRARYVSKWYGVNARLELREPSGDVIWCKDYFSCTSDTETEFCVLESPCAVDSDIGVIEECTLPNPVGKTDYRWPGDTCKLQIPLDGVLGSYELTVSDHPGVSPDVDPNSEFKKRNIAWSFTTDATGTDEGVDGGLLVPLGEPLTYEAARSRLCLKDITEGATLILSSENIFSGLAALSAIDDAVSLYKLDFGWSSLPATVEFSLTDDGCYRVHSELNFGKSHMAARLTQESGEPITAIIGGIQHGGLLPMTNSHFESVDNFTEGWLLQQEEEANVSVVPAENALEGAQSIQLVGKTTLRYNLEAPVAGPWLIRYLSQTSTAEPTTSCWVEIRQTYTAVTNPTLTYSTKPKCFPQTGGVSRGECRFEPVKAHPVTGDELELVALAVRLGSTFDDGDGNYCIFDELRVFEALADY